MILGTKRSAVLAEFWGCSLHFSFLTGNFLASSASPPHETPVMYSFLRCLGQRVLFIRINNSWTRPVHWMVKYAKLFSQPSKVQQWPVIFSKTGLACYAGLLVSLGLKEPSLNNEKHSEQVIIDNIKAAILAHQEGHSNKAEQLLHLALRVAQEQQHTEAVTYIYNTMANIALEGNELEKSLHLFKSVVKRLMASGMSGDNNVILEISIKLAGIYERLGKTAEAESGYSYCLKHLSRKAKTDDSTEDTALLWAMCADAYGRYLSNRNNFTEASSYFLQALDVCNQILGPSHPQTLVILNNLGSTYAMAGNYEDGIKYLKMAVEVAHSTKSEDFAAYCYNLGMLYLQMTSTVEAEFYCKRAVALFPPEGHMHKEALGCLNHIKLSNLQK